MAGNEMSSFAARLTIGLIALASVVLFARDGAAAEKKAETRVALVIGNSAYERVAKLTNPANDAKLIAEHLKALHFDVRLALDQDRAGMEHAVRSFGDKLRGADVALFYYAGHGLQVAGQNYLLPIGAVLREERDLPFETVEIDAVVKQM